MADQKAIDLFQDIDNTMKEYYVHFNKEKQYIQDNNGISILEQYFDDNGLDYDDFVTEMNGSINDSIIIEFDTNFPIKSNNLNNDQKQQVIFEIFKQIYSGQRNIQTLVTIGADQINFNQQWWMLGNNAASDQKLIDNAKNIYTNTCKTLMDNGMATDDATIRALAVGIKNHYPYLQFLADMYLRDSMKNKSDPLTESAWCQQNIHILALKNIKIPYLSNDKQPFQIITSALKSHCYRICPKLRLSAVKLIVDSVRDAARYIVNAVSFVYHLASQNKKTCPFQYDFCMAFKKTINAQNILAVNDDNDYDDDDSDSDTSNNSISKPSDNFVDCFGNIRDKLQKENLFYTIESVPELTYGLKMPRSFDTKFQPQITTTKYKNDYGDQTLSQYPRNKRFCGLIDRRKRVISSNPDDAKKNADQTDELIFFEPPDNCNTFPDKKYNAVYDQWYFNASRTCIIPNIGYNNGNNNNSLVVDNSLRHITSSSSCNGALLLLSFHVVSSEVIRCYIHSNCTASRFLPQDLIDILPNFFDGKYKKNSSWKKSNAAKELVKKIKYKLPDYQFDAFYNQFSNKT